MRKSILALAVGLIALALFAGLNVPAGESSAGSWTQWGGPHQEFRAPSKGLAQEWPADGPTKLWSRELGEGYSAILVEGGRLYTMYREGENEVVVCLNAEGGKTIWEHKYAASPHEGHVHQFGDGPRSTPLIDGKMLYTVGVSGMMHALDKSSGKVAWSHDLWEEFGGTVLQHGYSSSPIPYKNTIIALVGGEDQSIVAFDKKDGSVKWKGLSFKNSYSTPRVLDVAGEEQLIAFMADEVIGVDPDNGELKWSFPHQNQWEQNISMPIRIDENHLFISSPMVGAKGLKLTRDGEKINVEEVWSTRKIQFYHATTVREGDYVYGSTGTRTPAFMSALNMKTGEIAWRKRGYAKANCVGADGRLIILDEDGMLYLTTATPDDLVMHSKVELLSKVSWTVPTVVGKTLYVRDKTEIMALDLG
jgi:outer membrane protein assembly factor BamB